MNRNAFYFLLKKQKWASSENMEDTPEILHNATEVGWHKGIIHFICIYAIYEFIHCIHLYSIIQKFCQCNGIEKRNEESTIACTPIKGISFSAVFSF